VGRGVKEEACRIRELPTTCSRGAYARDFDLKSGIITGEGSLPFGFVVDMYGIDFKCMLYPE